jgi:hypothetical protein
MPKNPCLIAAALTGIFMFHMTFAQQDTLRTVKQRKFREYKRTFQFSLFPGISTNGVSSGHYYNRFSFNLLGGASAGNTFIEVGGLTNTNFKRSNGIQIAGLANLIGTNAFLNLNVSEERTLINNDFECSFKGIQAALLMNYVLDNAKGIQLSGGLNVVGRDFSGVQLALVGNSAGGTSIGFHLAGFYNVVDGSVAGVQISSIFNYTGEELSGTQIALINRAQWMMGRHSTPPTERRSLQIGLLNFCREMHGTQIGLINFGGGMRGKQFGVINFFQRMGSKEQVRMGTPVGLLNFGSYGTYFRINYSELFPLNAEVSTGNCMNCTWTQSTMPYWDSNQQLNQNVLIIGYDRWNETWGFGYGFQKLLYSKSSMNPKDVENKKRVITYGVRWLHLNRSFSFDKTLNLVTRLNFDWGKFKWGNRYKSYYWYVGASLNYFIYEDDQENTYSISSWKLASGTLSEFSTICWPGYNIGIQL